jgi:hypothetical protein
MGTVRAGSTRRHWPCGQDAPGAVRCAALAITCRCVDGRIGEFYAGYGADSATFLPTANSFVIEAKMAHGNELVRDYHVEGTPTLVVNGKYRVAMNSERSIGPAEAIKLTLYLVQQEAQAKGKAAN